MRCGQDFGKRQPPRLLHVKQTIESDSDGDYIRVATERRTCEGSEARIMFCDSLHARPADRPDSICSDQDREARCPVVRMTGDRAVGQTGCLGRERCEGRGFQLDGALGQGDLR